MESKQCTLYSGGLEGAESRFGEMAEKWGVKEVQYTFAGQQPFRNTNVTVLSEAELQRGDISMDLVSKMMGRPYHQADRIRKVLQTIFHMVNSGVQVFCVGSIREDGTVKGGTGWAVELGKLFNRPVHVFWQEKAQWYTWRTGSWQQDTPQIAHATFVGAGTRHLEPAGEKAIAQLFLDSFGPAAS